MKYIEQRDYESMCGELEERLNKIADENDWLAAISEDADEQLEHYANKNMCYIILSIMEEIERDNTHLMSACR